MKIRSLMVLPLAATMMLPAVAQQSAPTNQDQNQAAQSQPAQNDQATKSDQNSTARQPLAPEQREGFWGRINPFARKKYVQRQMDPIRNRVNEVDELSAQNAKYIKDVDSRAQEGIKMASAKADQADQHALDAGNRAQQAHQTAQQASTRLQTVEQVVTNFDQYAPTNQTELRFRSGQATLNKNAKAALDEIAASLKDQKGYIVEIQGFSPGNSAASIQASQKMADAVVRYLVINHEIPVYRVFTLGMGNAKVQTVAANQDQDANGKPARAYRGPRVEVSVLKNSSIDQLNQQAMASTPQQGNGQTMSGAASQSQYQGGAAMNSNTGVSYNNQAKPSAPQPSPESQQNPNSPR
jgi:outer membrane protein OmpA-like peptidoglycan-associated protein